MMKNDLYKEKLTEILTRARNGNWILKLIVFQFAEAVFVPLIVVLMVFVVLAMSYGMEIAQNLRWYPSGILLRILMVVIIAWLLVNFTNSIKNDNFLSLEKPLKVPEWGEKREKNCLLDCNGKEGPCPGFCGGSPMLNSFCCSKDQSGTVRCPKSAKFAVTSETNSCITLNAVPDDEELNLDESDDDNDIEDDPNSSMLIQTPQVSYEFIKFVWNFELDNPNSSFSVGEQGNNHSNDNWQWRKVRFKNLLRISSQLQSGIEFISK